MTDIVEYFKKRKYKVKYILYYTIKWSDQNYLEETMTYLLLENGFSKRKLEIKSYGLCETYEKSRETELYRQVILPWLRDIDGPLKEHMKTYSGVVERDDNETITVEEKGKIITIKRDE